MLQKLGIMLLSSAPKITFMLSRKLCKFIAVWTIKLMFQTGIALASLLYQSVSKLYSLQTFLLLNLYYHLKKLS